MEHKSGLIHVMDEKCNSADLAVLSMVIRKLLQLLSRSSHIVDSVGA
ncbi:MAG: hypothetical protein ACLTCP_13685 [Ruminococcus bicirculans (ex Wegman et al. 2014)]